MRHPSASLPLALLLAIAASGFAADQTTSILRVTSLRDDGGSHPSAPPPTSSEAWNAQGSDHILLYRPSLVERAKAEVPAGRSSNIPALLQAMEKLLPLAATHPGHSHTRGKSWEPETVYEPTDDELLLSLAGDRVWRSLQLAPPDVLERVAAENPSLHRPIDYPHIEIVRLEVAGTGPEIFALPPVNKHLVVGRNPTPANAPAKNP